MSVSFTTLIENYAKYRNRKKCKTNINISTDITDVISNSNSDQKIKSNQIKDLLKTHTLQLNKDTIQLQNTKYDLTLIERSRVDSRGVPILKGSKNHKVTFKDKIGKHNNRLVEVIDIESYKIENGTFNYNDPNKNKQSSSSVSCCIIF
jgi:hypothetical protein